MQQVVRKSIAYLAASFIAAVGEVHACDARSEATRGHLVELYTSEGCSSCPPAEQWMSSIRANAQLVGLEFHVDYWDSPAWRDPYSKQAWAKRQQEKAQRAKVQIYTPQIWLDGKPWRNWPKSEALVATLAAPTTPSIVLSMSAGPVAAGAISVRLQAGSAENSARKHFYAALVENRLVQEIRGGENKGRRLEHDQVVRNFAGPLPLPEAQAELKIPPDTMLANAAVVAFVQDEDGDEVEQVLRMPLSECKP